MRLRVNQLARARGRARGIDGGTADARAIESGVPFFLRPLRRPELCRLNLCPIAGSQLLQFVARARARAPPHFVSDGDTRNAAAATHLLRA